MRQFTLLFAAAIASFAFAAPALAAGNSLVADDDALELPLAGAINGYRASIGLKNVRVSPKLSAAARAHAVSMARGGYFSHTSADGTVFWKRVERYYPSTGFYSWSVGETLLWVSGRPTPEQALQMWLDSAPHRKVLSTAPYREIGLAAVTVSAAPGVFGSQDVTIVAADFGVRSR
jgi:uncharacterized protein YkwD